MNNSIAGPSNLSNELIKGEEVEEALVDVEMSTTTGLDPSTNLAINELLTGLNQTNVVLVEPPEPIKTKKELEQEKKDLNLNELLNMMEDWNPIIPDEVTDYYLQKSGFETSDLRVKRLLALAAQRFISSISADSYQYARTRTQAGTNKTKEGTSAKAIKDRTRTVLTMEDLAAALKEYGVGADRAQYYL